MIPWFSIGDWGFEIADFFKDPLLFRKLTTLILIVENEIAVDSDLKNAAVSLDQCGIKTKIIFDRGRQTGCHGQETSFHTVGDFDGYGFLSFVVHVGFIKVKLRRYTILKANPP